MMEIKSAVVEHGWENHMGGDIGVGPSEGTGAVSTLHIYMRTSEECFSRDEGLEISGCWITVTRIKAGREEHPH